MKEFMVFCGIIIGMLMMVVICFKIAKSKKVQRFLLKEGPNWILGQVDETIIEEMKEIARKGYENKETLVEASKKYTIVIELVNEYVEGISVKYQTATVMKSKEELHVFDTGVSEKRAREAPGFCLCVIVFFTVMLISMGVSVFIW